MCVLGLLEGDGDGGCFLEGGCFFVWQGGWEGEVRARCVIEGC